MCGGGGAPCLELLSWGLMSHLPEGRADVGSWSCRQLSSAAWPPPSTFLSGRRGWDWCGCESGKVVWGWCLSFSPQAHSLLMSIQIWSEPKTLRMSYQNITSCCKNLPSYSLFKLKSWRVFLTISAFTFLTKVFSQSIMISISNIFMNGKHTFKEKQLKATERHNVKTPFSIHPLLRPLISHSWSHHCYLFSRDILYTAKVIGIKVFLFLLFFISFPYLTSFLSLPDRSLFFFICVFFKCFHLSEYLVMTILIDLRINQGSPEKQNQ